MGQRRDARVFLADHLLYCTRTGGDAATDFVFVLDEGPRQEWHYITQQFLEANRRSMTWEEVQSAFLVMVGADDKQGYERAFLALMSPQRVMMSARDANGLLSYVQRFRGHLTALGSAVPGHELQVTLFVAGLTPQLRALAATSDSGHAWPTLAAAVHAAQGAQTKLGRVDLPRAMAAPMQIQCAAHDQGYGQGRLDAGSPNITRADLNAALAVAMGIKPSAGPSHGGSSRAWPR